MVLFGDSAMFGTAEKHRGGENEPIRRGVSHTEWDCEGKTRSRTDRASSSCCLLHSFWQRPHAKATWEISHGNCWAPIWKLSLWASLFHALSFPTGTVYGRWRLGEVLNLWIIYVVLKQDQQRALNFLVISWMASIVKWLEAVSLNWHWEKRSQ